MTVEVVDEVTDIGDALRLITVNPRRCHSKCWNEVSPRMRPISLQWRRNGLIGLGNTAFAELGRHARFIEELPAGGEEPC